jgi:hypothetical protein
VHADRPARRRPNDLHPLYWYPRLLGASEEQRDDWELIGGGIGVHWPQIDEDLSLGGMLRGVRAPEKPPDLLRRISRQSAEDFFGQFIGSLKAQIQNYREQLEQYSQQLPEGDIRARLEKMTDYYYELEGSIDQEAQDQGIQDQMNEAAEGAQQKMKEFAQGATTQEVLEYEGEGTQKAQERAEDPHTA